MSRKQAREGAMKLLFQLHSTEDYGLENIEVFLNNFIFDESEQAYIEDAVRKVVENLDTIDAYIEKHLEGWSVYRLAKVDLAVLRIAIYEILYRKDIPVEVSINEAIEIAKKYSKEDSFKFINGVLGGFVRDLDKKSDKDESS